MTNEASDLPKMGTSTGLAFERTFLAYERTLMAWTRTSVSLIGFGFTIYKFFQYLKQEEEINFTGMLGTRLYGISFIIVGLLSLLIATLQHRQSLSTLRRKYQKAPKSLASLLAAMISVLGILALLAAIFRQ
jgi:putative membrane protein